MSENGKGSRQRPKSVNQEIWDKNYENIFGKREKNSRPAVDKTITEDTMKESMRENQSRD